ncbi:unnamed protein product [Ceutorhynchus assimilis]|uniref:Uncharacterized protein n=1 Tax=Ceutorhynchus assimilis TaxID=467358 RepID=A0A9N9N0J5_9CUCU|nr:unnamed protein product [Ceutorhynchus assimilis]
MASCTTDSGTETLFSDDSPCELLHSPNNACSGDERLCPSRQNEDGISINSKLAPPNIQPYSGVLEKGKVVIKPIAFKPSAPNNNNMMPSSRFSDRYGSTPILTRPGSRTTMYGSTSDIHNSSNILSLDRKLRSSCTSNNSSPPLAMSSLPSIPHTHKLLNYDSLESVRKSSNSNCSFLNKNSSYRLSSSNIGRILDLTPSPSDSGVSELEAALRDRDSELAYLRQTMEHNEQVIFRVYQEKEKVWERELHRIKSVHEERLRSSAQKALKLEQLLMMQTYQQNQNKKQLLAEVHRATFENDKFKEEVTDLRNRLEETEWNLCQKTGEIALLKTQLKECQTEHTSKCQELFQLRIEYRELHQQFEELENQLNKQKTQYEEKNNEISDLHLELETLKYQVKKYQSIDSIDKARFEDISENERLKAEIKELREELSDFSISDYSNVQPGRQKPQIYEIEHIENQENCDSLEDLEIQKLNEDYIDFHENENEVGRLRRQLTMKSREFEKEKLIWAQEKEKVLRYQRQLQINYMEMYKRSQRFEGELENLSLELAVLRSKTTKELQATTL